MKVAQLDYSAIANAYQSLFGSKQAEVAVADQKSYKRYMDKAHSLQKAASVFEGAVKLGTAGYDLYNAIDTYNMEKDAQEAAAALGDAALQLKDGMNRVKIGEGTGGIGGGSGTVGGVPTGGATPTSDSGGTGEGSGGGTLTERLPDGSVDLSPDAAGLFDEIIGGYRNPDWHPDVLKQFDEGAEKLRRGFLSDAIDSDWASTFDALNKGFLDNLESAIEISAASPANGTKAIDDVIASATFLNDAQKKYYSDTAYAAYDDKIQRNTVAALGQILAKDRMTDYISNLPIGAEEKNALYSLGAATIAQMESIVEGTASNMMTELLNQGVLPEDARLQVESYARMQGLSEEGVDIAIDGINSAQKAYAMDTVSGEMTRLMNGYMSLDEIKEFDSALNPTGRLGVTFYGIEDQVATIRDDFINPAIESYNTAINDATEDEIKRFEADCNAILASDAYSIKEKNDYIVTRSMNNPALWAKAKELQDKLMEQVFDPACESLIDRWDPMVESILKKAAGDAWGTERGIKYMSDYVGFRNDLMAWGMAHSDKGFTEQDLDAYIQGTLLPYYLGKAMDAAGGLEELAEDDVSLVTAGVFSDDTSRLGDYVELALDPQMAGTVIPDSSTGGYRFTTGDGPAQLYAEAYTLLSTGLNNMGIVATQIYPFEDADGEAYPFPIARDADGREFALGKKGIVIRPVGDEVTMPTDWLPVSAKDVYTGREDKATEPQDVYGLDGAGQVVRLGTTPGRKASDKELDAELERDWNMRDYPDLSKQPTIKANDEASRIEPASVQENEPAVRIRQMPITDLTRTGRQGSEQFWYQGRWYWVDELDQDGEIFRAYLEEAMKRNG